MEELILRTKENMPGLSSPSTVPNGREEDKLVDQMGLGESEVKPACSNVRISIEDLPPEVQSTIFDHIFGDMQAVTSGSSVITRGSKSITSSMRHPRRKAVSNLALICRAWCTLVQERIYRHIKIKGTRAGIHESEEWFLGRRHLAEYVRHIEFWVPVWGEKTSLDTKSFDIAVPTPTDNRNFHQLAYPTDSGLMTANELLGFNFKLSVYSATLSEIFFHTAAFFDQARILTIEGGHCKKSNMIRHFPRNLFPDPNSALHPLPNITTFVMRGAWNIMREHSHWKTIEAALPNIEEWQCNYAKPRPEAYNTINSILLSIPSKLRHATICLDGFYAKETSLSSLASSSHSSECAHLCQRLGRITPYLESLSYTGKICACFWTAAAEALRKSREEPKLKVLEVVVKKCCRPPIPIQDPETGESTLAMIDDVMADSASITNMTFIRGFEHFVVATVSQLDTFVHLRHIRIRFIDLDSPCALLNPYFLVRGSRCYGLWNEEILDLLKDKRPGLEFEELGDGLGVGWRKEGEEDGAVEYPSAKPKAIKSSSYRLLVDARG